MDLATSWSTPLSLSTRSSASTCSSASTRSEELVNTQFHLFLDEISSTYFLDCDVALTKDGAGSGSVVSSETAVQEPVGDDLKRNQMANAMRLRSLGSRRVLVKDTAFQTWYTFLNYLYTDKSSFLPLRLAMPVGQSRASCTSTSSPDEPRGVPAFRHSRFHPRRARLHPLCRSSWLTSTVQRPCIRHHANDGQYLPVVFFGLAKRPEMTTI
ncbi:hypothetical protein L210DRAFT_989927 [Boletus edulis BED1]|uniref:Uncharacterized protein n=1 Tax=Boletus edulis BED1 TaxID=1328754 RepID=A0AAD4BDS7_BOLED|nr:hypothetical protein L210DRAFT_989927 [Boletus edulis BED1]